MRPASLAAAVLVAAIPVLALPSVARAHGGVYQPPLDAPPEDPPSDPPPPPGRNPGKGPTTGGGDGPPVSDGGGGGPTTGGGEGLPPPTTGGGGGAPTTGGGTPGAPAPGNGDPTTGGGGPTGGPPTAPPSRKAARSGIDPDHWTRWWYGHREVLLGADFRARNNAATTAGNRDAEAAREAMARAEVQRALAGALSDRDEDVASGAAIALGRGGDPADAALLLDVLQDHGRQTSVREAAALGLGLLPGDASDGGGAVTRALLALAEDSREPVRLRAIAVWSLGLRRDAAAVPFLLEAAGDRRAHRDVTGAAVSALGLTGCTLAREDLEALLEPDRARLRDEDVLRSVHAAHALAHLGDRDALPALLAATRRDDEDVRRAAILALGALGTPEDAAVLQRLGHLLERDRDRACRNMAALSLGRIGSPRSETVLRYAYEKGDSLHQPFAALAIGLWCRRNGDASAAAPLRRDLRERSNPDLRGALAVALGLARDPASVKTLHEVVEDRGNNELRAHAATALGMTKDPASADVLRKVLETTNDPALQRETALALGLLGDVQAVRTLVRLVQEEDSLYVQGAAAVSLGRIGGEDTSSVLRDLLDDRSRPGLARAFAAVGLGRLLDRTQGRGLARVGQDLDWYLLSPSAAEILTIL